jgi:DNA-binding transcriptional regulator YiaG
MKRCMAGRSVGAAGTTVFAEPDFRAIREAARISRAEIAKQIGVNVRTLQNFETHWTR